MKIHSLNRIFMNYFRPRRLEKFRGLFPEATIRTIVDVGGGRAHWDQLGGNADVTIVNVEFPRGEDRGDGRYSWVEGDGTKLQFADQAFDLAFSNSVIEHVGDVEDQARFAAELRRVGEQVYCQTPNRWFFVEPHLITPFIHWLPRAWLTYPLVRYCTIWGWLAKPSPSYVQNFISTTRLLTRADMQRLFPDCEIQSERFLFMTKSFIAVRRRRATAAPRVRSSSR